MDDLVQFWYFKQIRRGCLLKFDFISRLHLNLQVSLAFEQAQFSQLKMQIKYNLTASTSASSKHRGLFRSIRYKVRSTQTSHNNSIEHQSSRQPQTAPNYATIRVKRTAPTPEQSPLNRTSLDWSYMLPAEQPSKQEYIETFKSMMGSRTMARRLGSVDWRRSSRVQLPSLEENQESKFCMLDPMTVTIQYIDELYEESSLLLKKNTKDAQDLSKELKDLNEATLRNLQELVTDVGNRFASIRNCLRRNQLSQLQNKLKYRKEVDGFQKEMGQVKETFDDLLEKNQKLQTRVFNSLPYQLVENTNLPIIHEPFQEKLF